MTAERVRRWDVALAATAALIGTGVVTVRPVLVVAGAVPMLFVVVGALSTVPEVDSLVVDRSLSASTPAPGDRVEVTLTVRNTGESAMTDVRIVDGVPGSLAVTDGSPRASLALRPGDESSLSYTVVARRGDHAFRTPVLRVRSLPATVRRTETVTPTGASALTCRLLVDEVPLRDETTGQVGSLATETPGVGLEFFATRQYRRGDAARRIDWRQFAKSRTLTTVQYREQRAAQVVLVVDGRDPVSQRRAPGHPDGAELVSYAADRAFTALRGAGHHVGVLAVGLDPDDVDTVLPSDSFGIPWVEPGATPEVTARVRSVLQATADAHPDRRPRDATSGRPSDGPDVRSRESSPVAGGADTSASPRADGGRRGGSDPTDDAVAVLDRLTANTQVLLLSPLVDDEVVDLGRRLRAGGYRLTVVSPDVTDAETTGQSVERTRRALRLRELRRVGASTVDWDPATPLHAALSSALDGVIGR